MIRGSEAAKEAGRKAAETRRLKLAAMTGPEVAVQVPDDAEFAGWVGKGVSYFDAGWRYGILLSVSRGRAVIEHAANAYRKEQVKVPVQDVKLYASN